MALPDVAYVNSVREQLLAGRARLDDVLASGEKRNFDHLLNQVDQALQRIEHGTFGICEECHTDIGEEWLREDPLTTVCLEHMTPKQQRMLEYDLELAAQIQKGLLPPADFAMPGWQVGYHYAAASAVSGDYCDLIQGNDGEMYFVMADVSGKGVAAAMLSSNLRAIFRSLVPMGLSSAELMNRANRIFRQSALPSQYATLVFGKATPGGEVEMVNAGHLPALLACNPEMKLMESTHAPLGMFDDQEFTATHAALHGGDMLVLYTDGICEAENDSGDEYGLERLRSVVEAQRLECPATLVGACKDHLAKFRGRRERLDDETILAIQYAPTALSADGSGISIA